MGQEGRGTSVFQPRDKGYRFRAFTFYEAFGERGALNVCWDGFDESLLAKSELARFWQARGPVSLVGRSTSHGWVDSGLWVVFLVLYFVLETEA